MGPLSFLPPADALERKKGGALDGSDGGFFKGMPIIILQWHFLLCQPIFGPFSATTVETSPFFEKLTNKEKNA